MERKRKLGSLTTFEFRDQCPDDKSCLAYLVEQKWINAFAYYKYDDTKYSMVGDYCRQCIKCYYINFQANGNFFNTVKFLLIKTFNVVCKVSIIWKSLLSTELNCRWHLKQMIGKLFKQNVMVVSTV